MISLPAIEDMKGRAQWVAYSAAKVPVNPHTGRAASSTDPKTWGTCDEAKWRMATASLPGVGFVFSEGDPYIGIDLDHAIDPATEQLYEWAERIVKAVDSYTELSPSGLGLHIICVGAMTRAGAQRNIDGVSSAGGKVEMYSSRRYFTVTGRWLRGTRRTIEERSDEVATLEKWCGVRSPESASKPSRGSGGGAGTGGGYETDEDVTWLHGALSVLSSESYEDWVRIGMALKSEMGEAGFSWFDQWSATSPKYGGRDKTWRKWCGFPDSSDIGFGSVVYMAEQQGWTKPDRPRRELPEGFRDGWDEWLAEQDAAALVQADPVQASAGLRVEWISLAAAYVDHSPFEPPLVAPGVLGPGDIMVVFGPPKSGKSMLLLDMLTRFATGKQWHGMHPAQPLTVAYMQYELKADAMRQRVQRLDLDDDDLRELASRFWYTPRFSCVIGPELFAEVQAARQAWPWLPDVLVIDPISNVFGGKSENDNTEMMHFVKQLKALRNAFSPSTALILVHHASKGKREDRNADPFQTLRGAGSLRGVYDTGIYVDAVQKDGQRRVNVQFELRNGAPLPELWFEHSPEGGGFVPIDIEAAKEDDKRAKRDRLRGMEQDVYHFTMARIAAAGGKFEAAGTIADAWALAHPSDTAKDDAYACVASLSAARQLGFHRKPGNGNPSKVGRGGYGYVVRVEDGPTHVLVPNTGREPGARRNKYTEEPW